MKSNNVFVVVLGSTIAAHQILGESHDHSHEDEYPPIRRNTIDLNMCAVTSPVESRGPTIVFGIERG